MLEMLPPVRTALPAVRPAPHTQPPSPANLPAKPALTNAIDLQDKATQLQQHIWLGARGGAPEDSANEDAAIVLIKCVGCRTEAQARPAYSQAVTSTGRPHAAPSAWAAAACQHQQHPRRLSGRGCKGRHFVPCLLGPSSLLRPRSKLHALEGCLRSLDELKTPKHKVLWASPGAWPW